MSSDVNSIIQTGLAGVLSGMQSAAQHVDEINQAFTGASAQDPIEPIVGLTQDETQVKASAAVIKVGQDLTQSVLDLLA